jgi:phenylalanyl-tRNA synthetase beta chain
MLISLKWLKDYVNVDLAPGELADRLTMCGLEVDAIHETTPGFSSVVAAKILTMKPHPNADKCFLCDVTAGEVTYPVVCGVGNMRAGDMVPLAKIGATLPGGYTIKSSKIRGEVSEGMLCSEAELGIGDDESGIMILPPDSTPGEDLADLLDLKDTVLDIGITPNRADCLSIIGIAREVAAVTGGTLRYPAVSVHEAAEDVQGMTSVEILDADLCPRYSARIIKNVKVAPSPLWMRNRLESVGIRAINNIVDITNFVMMEWGQPLHAFDYRFLEEGRIVVRRSRPGERFVSLDEKERILKPDTLMICDGVKPVAIAGIMGGLNSEVKEDTETVLLESAYFNPSSIRKSAKWLGMNTDAAFRFGRGVDPDGVIRASNRAAQLMSELAGGVIWKGTIDQYPKTIETAADIPLRIDRVNQILGTDIPADEIVTILKKIEMTVRVEGDRRYRVTPPTYRVDITREIDLIEEVARLYGYDKVHVTIPDISVMTQTGDQIRMLEDKIRLILNASGYSEVITYSFITPNSADILNFTEDDARRSFVKIRNPLTEDQSVMRSTLIYGLLETMKKNADIGCFDLRMFEIGRIFIHKSEGELPTEKKRVAGLLTVHGREDDWLSKEATADFYDVKGFIENILDGFKLSYDVRFESAHEEYFLHPGKSCAIYAGNKRLGFFGEIHPDVFLRMDLKSTAVVFELDLDILSSCESGDVVYSDLPKFPSVTRDVAFLVEQEMEAGKLLRLALGADKELLEKVSIFDVYTGKSIPSGMKSLGLRFSYRGAEKTLTDDEVNKVHSGIISMIIDVTGARIRGE